MKLRNKRTGDIIVGKCFTDIIEVLGKRGELIVRPALLNLDLFTKYWEETYDYTPTEPLIKDEKVRNAVRAWAEVNTIKTLMYIQRSGDMCKLMDMGVDDYCIELVGWIPTLKDGNEYTITELCGEEEE